MENDRSTSPSSMSSSHDEHDSDLPEVRTFQPIFKLVQNAI